MQILCHNYVVEIPSKRAIFTLFACADLQSVHPIGLCSFDAVSGVISYFRCKQACNILFVCGIISLMERSFLHTCLCCVLRFFVWRNGSREGWFFGTLMTQMLWMNADFIICEIYPICVICVLPLHPEHTILSIAQQQTRRLPRTPSSKRTHTPTVKELFWFSTMSDFVIFLTFAALFLWFSY